MSEKKVDVIDISKDARLKRLHGQYQERQAILMTVPTADLIAELVRRGLTPKEKEDE